MIRGYKKALSNYLFNTINRKNGMSILMLVLIVLVIVAFYAFQHIFTAQTRARQAHKLFFLNSAMNLAETAIQIANFHVENEMNDPNYNSGNNFWYSNFRKSVDSSEGISQDLKNLPQISKMLEQYKDKNAKIKELKVTLKAVDKFYDLSGNPESFRDIEKCGSLEFKCISEFMGTSALIKARRDFKVTQIRHPILNNYVLFVKDAFNEYCSTNNIGYPSSYKDKPGSHEGYNPKDHYLLINAKPDSNLPAGRVLFGGPMDTDKKIIINLSDKDTDLMDEVWDNAGAINKIWGDNSKSVAKAGGDAKMPAGELEAVFRSLFYDPDNPLTDSQWNDIKDNTVFLFKKKNCGFTPTYVYGKNVTPPYPKSQVADADTAPKTSLKDMSDLDDLAKEDWVFGAPTSNYLASMLIFTEGISKPTGPYKWIKSKLLNNQDIPVTNSTSGKIARETYVHYNHSTDTKRCGIDIFGAPGNRQFCIVEGNVWQRYTSLSVLSLEMTLPAPANKTYNINFVIPGFYYTIPADVTILNPGKDDVSLDNKAFLAFLDQTYNDANLERIYIYGAMVVRDESGKKVGRPFNTIAGSSGINYNSEVVVRPYNMGHPDVNKLSLSQNEAIATLVPPPRGYEEIIPLIKNKNAVIYENESEFFEKCATKAVVNGMPVTLLNLHGNVIIKSDLHLTGNPIVYKGCGIITTAPDTSGNTPVPRHIYIGTKILKSSANDLLCLYSNWGSIIISADNLEINASLIALHPFFDSSKNLVSFITSSPSFNNLKIKGNVLVDRLNLASFPKNTTIEYDQLFHELQTEDDYFVSLSKRFNYWVKELL